MNTIPTTEKLALALTQARAPQWMIDKSRAGYYDDFKSPIATPIVQLYHDCLAAGLGDLAMRARNGDFDSTDEEADEWAKSPEGQETFRKLLAGE